MAGLKTHEGALTAADLATFGIPPKPIEGPQLVKGPDQEKLGREDTVSERVAVMQANRGRLRKRSIRIGKAVGSR